jgi:hypothetical protein
VQKRKYIRIALTPKDEEALAEARADLERATGIAMTESQFVLGALRQRLQEHGPSKG